MKLIASDFYTAYNPSKCDLRVYLDYKGVKPTPPGPYDEVIKKFGRIHEQAHLKTFPEVIDLSDGTPSAREARTREEVGKKSSVLYQGVLMANVRVGEVECEIVGEPDFMIHETDGYVIRDSKISRRVNEQDHPEIYCQLGLYGLLFEKTFQVPPVRLEVHKGDGAIEQIPYDGGAKALEVLNGIVSIRSQAAQPYSPVGWSKCKGCGYFEVCWPLAEKTEDVSLIGDVDQGLAIALHRDGVLDLKGLVARFNVDTLGKYERPWGKKTQRVGKKAESILQTAKALLDKKEILLKKPEIPQHNNYVMFDLEGLPPHLNELEKIYLWGIQVYGNNPGSFLAATAGFDQQGDKEGWEQFLKNADSIFQVHGDIPFVHWHHYEKVHLDMYIDRFGDVNGIAERVRRNLLDLLPITKASIVLPLPSFSLKVIEKHINFKRTQNEFGGEWSMAKYIEAVEAGDEILRKEALDDILVYNKEDLASMWAIFQWLRAK